MSPDGKAAICARVESNNRRGAAGWLHWLDDNRIYIPRPLPIRPASQVTEIDWTTRARVCHHNMTAGQWLELASLLDISTETLTRLRWGWSRQHSCWTVPMRDSAGKVIGIRTRHPDGSKRAIRGSRSGLFYIPGSITSRVVICEGPSDAAALIDVGIDSVVGRPSCSGGADLILQLLQSEQVESVVIVPDADVPGITGAESLATAIARQAAIRSTNITAVIPPDGINDCRDWKRKDPDGLRDAIGVEPISWKQK